MNELELLKEQFKVYRTYGEPYKRFGEVYDGGYVMVDDLKITDYVISCGIGDGDKFAINTAIEEEISDNVAGIDMYDIADIDISQMSRKLKFYNKNIGNDFGLEDMLLLSGDQKDYILKMDIEGSEWPFFLNAKPEDISKFRQIVVEFHDLASHVLHPESFNTVLSIFKKINATHNIAIIHPNNCGLVSIIEHKVVPQVVEILFLRKDSYNFIDIDYPELLNNSNCHLESDISLFYH